MESLLKERESDLTQKSPGKSRIYECLECLDCRRMCKEGNKVTVNLGKKGNISGYVN